VTILEQSNDLSREMLGEAAPGPQAFATRRIWWTPPELAMCGSMHGEDGLPSWMNKQKKALIAQGPSFCIATA
jgi:hypothetical protein